MTLGGVEAVATIQAGGMTPGVGEVIPSADFSIKTGVGMCSPRLARATWHGANAGDDSMRDLPLVSVIGGRSAPHRAIADLAAANGRGGATRPAGTEPRDGADGGRNRARNHRHGIPASRRAGGPCGHLQRRHQSGRRPGEADTADGR
jgi:hypothetical protein